MNALPLGPIVGGLVFSLVLLAFPRGAAYVNLLRMRQAGLPVSERSDEDRDRVARVYLMIGGIGAAVFLVLLALKFAS